MTVQRIKTGDISTRIGMTVTAELITSIGFPPDETMKRAKLWDADKFPAICDALAKHVRKQANSTATAPTKSKPAEQSSLDLDDDDDL